MRLPRLATLLFALALSGCAAFYAERHHSTSLMAYLYPESQPQVVKEETPLLTLPLRIGLAFVPSSRESRGSPLTPSLEQALLERVRDEFIQYDYIENIALIPSSYLRSGGGFANLEQLRGMFGIDLMALISYDQMQFTDEGMLSFTYWTVIGAYVIRGDMHDTHTLLDLAVFDLDTQRLLLRAPGSSQIQANSTLVNMEQTLRDNARNGLTQATEVMMTQLHSEMARFEAKLKRAEEQGLKAPARVEHRSGGGGGAFWGMLGILLLAHLRRTRRLLTQRGQRRRDEFRAD